MEMPIKKLVMLGGVSLLVMLNSPLQAAGYKMEFQSASVLADAGDAAVVEDAGTNWYNSAGLVDLPQQLVVSAIDVYAPTTFTGSASAPASPFFPPSFGFMAQGSASSHPNNVLPAIHYTIPFDNSRFAFGISVVPAWGFTENYGDSIARYDLVRVYTKSIDIAPSLSWKINSQWSVGAGPDFNYFSVLSSGNVRTEGPVPFGTSGDSLTRFSANDWNAGAHAGVLWIVDKGTRVGLNYRTKIVMDMSGYSDFALNNGPMLYETNLFKLAIPLPPTTTLSVYHDLTRKWALMGTLAYDQWNVLKAYNAQNYITPPALGSTSPTLTPVSIPQNMSNTVDIGIGAHYRYSDRLLLRGSLKYEPTPTNNQTRDINFPDNNKLGVNLGFRYQITPAVAMDAIYAHVFVKSAPINITNLYGANLNGHSNTSIDLFGAQLVWNI